MAGPGLSPIRNSLSTLFLVGYLFSQNFIVTKYGNMIRERLFQFEKETTWQDAGNGVQRQVFGYDDRVMLVKALFAKGGRGSLHSHPHSQVTYVESGVFEMTIGDQTRIIRKGDGYYVPPNAVHGCVCLEAGMLVDAFSPHREDFISADRLNNQVT